MIYSLALITGLLLIALGFSMFGLDKNSSQISSMHEMSLESELASKVEADLIAAQLVFKDFLNTSDKTLISEYEAYTGAVDRQVQNLVKMTSSGSRKEILSGIESAYSGYNLGFSQFQELDASRAVYYADLSLYGDSIVVALATLTEQAAVNQDKALELKVSEASNELLQARLHGMKFFTFHNPVEFELYQEDYADFMAILNSLKDIKLNIDYKLEYNALKQNGASYESGMLELFDLIMAMDQKVDMMNEYEKEILSYIDDLRLSINSDTEGLEDQVKSDSLRMISIATGMSIVVIVLTIFIGTWMIGVVFQPIKTLEVTFENIARGDVDLDFRLPIKNDDEIGAMSKSFNEFMVNLKEIMDEISNQNWIKTAQTDLNKIMRQPDDVKLLAQAILTFLCQYVGAEVGTMYLAEEDQLDLSATYSFDNRKGLRDHIQKGEGLIGQCAIERQAFIMSDIPEGYMNIQSGLGDKQPRNIIVFPCEFEEEVKAVIELATFNELTDRELNLLRAMSDAIAISIHSTIVQDQLKDLLDRTLNQSEELQMQQEELRQSNEELEEQTRALKESEQRLQAQQEELRVSNEELEQRTKELEVQKKVLDDNNREILIKQQEIIEKAEQLELANTYKSEFLANMSHELRTPLNSILVLSELLAQKGSHAPLTDKEIEFANTINTSGKDLLALINDVLDLSKVEAGHLDIQEETLDIRQLLDESERMFTHMAEVKGIQFATSYDQQVGETITCDSLRLHQIIKNLVSNALKFTEKGGVRLSVRQPSAYELDSIEGEGSFVAFEVKDTGIGIPQEKQQLIFEAFRQSDGTTSRKFGGTGLGLTISRELAGLLGGHILVESTPGQGSIFVLLLPKDHESVQVDQGEIEVIEEEQVESHKIDSKPSPAYTPNRLLIIEDDETFSSVLQGLSEEKGFECITATTGAEGLEKAMKFKPSAIVLDLGLPDMDGMGLAEKLSRLDETKNIPIHIISGKESNNKVGLPMSIIGVLKKPVDVKTIYKTLSKIESVTKSDNPKLLVVGPCGDENFDQFGMLGSVSVNKVDQAEDALDILETEAYDCIVLDYQLSDSKEEVFKKITQLKGGIPTIIYSDVELDQDKLEQINSYSDSIILKSSKSNERLMDEVSLFLHDMKSVMKNHTGTSSYHMDMVLDELKDQVKAEDYFQDKRVLIVDDDERNVFALSSVLSQHDFKIEVSNNGQDAIDRMTRQEGFDVILMDIMMPVMDGYDAIRGIRKLDNGKDVPIIALTAKAMQEDRRKCIEAGANDYLTKPINVENLISILKVWLS